MLLSSTQSTTPSIAPLPSIQLIREYGGCESPCPDLDTTETSVETEETNLSSEVKYSYHPDYEPPSNPLRSIDSVCDLTDIMLLDQKILSNTIGQRGSLRADLLWHVEGVLDTLADSFSLLFQTRNYLDDLISGLLSLQC